ncbi:hypothetical protein F5148DRAFT_233524 [Russula earlei]|uniref:Uncharacterized protein n=1 Tax=Russula earlei TaxID=71964 RepID=A0ACC0U4W7_9AGAM|nr:hypothetical protein F5148DRAFT_233524 [Russula earlei]
MLIILAILAATRAFPLGQSSPPLVSPNQFQPRSPSCDDPDGCRSLWHIIWSCAVTILLCTWVSVHPNIPGPDETWPRVTLRRIGLMLGALFVPEFMVAWALKQRQVAVDLAKEHEEEGWTITHGFFAIMGGFMEYEGNRPVRVLLPEELRSYSLTGNGDFPRISKAEIKDKSKGDVVSKTLVILQTSWFVTQCIARGVRGLPITELELITVAFATLNFVMYLLWWDKPLNVQCGVRVYKKRYTEQPIDDGRVEATRSDGFWGALGSAFSDLPAAIVHGPFARDTDFRNASWIARVLMWPVVKPFEILDGNPHHEDENLKRVHTFHPEHWVTGEWPGFFAVFIMAAIALAFGGIHCVGWSFTFPSSIERILWRIASISIIVVPPLFLSFMFAGNHFNFSNYKLYHFTLTGTYMLGRLTLLVLPFLVLDRFLLQLTMS